jgi:hypothetical protein
MLNSPRAMPARFEPAAEETMQLSNYLFFTTTCEDALAFYAECGLGRVAEILRHGENGLPVKSEAMRGKVMHAKFEGPAFSSTPPTMTMPSR